MVEVSSGGARSLVLVLVLVLVVPVLVLVVVGRDGSELVADNCVCQAETATL